MKEATGELSMTAIVVVILGVVAVAAPFVVKTATSTMKMRVACHSAYGCQVCDTATKPRTCRYVPDPKDVAEGTAVGTEISNGEYSITCSCDNEDSFNN